MEPREPVHGRLGTYTNHKCRCELCRAANAAYMCAFRKRKVVAQEVDATTSLPIGEGAQRISVGDLCV